MRILITLLLSLLAASSAAQSDQLEQLFARFRQAAGFDHQYPREKVYLHLDNNAYLTGETMWFKAYVVRTSTLQPSGLSRVLYVDLLNAYGQVVDRRLLRLDSLGQANGEFPLVLPVRSGYYEVRAYTREMVNWGAEACFSRVVPIFASPRRDARKLRTDDIDPSRLSVALPDSALLPPADAWREAPPRSQRGRVLSFYPEGGRRVAGTTQRVAFRLSDEQGRPVADTLRLLLPDGSEVGRAVAGAEGMGLFTLPAGMDAGFAAVRTRRGVVRFALPQPAPDETFALTALRRADGVELLLAGRPAERGGHERGLLGLAVFCREQACYFDTLTLADDAPASLFLPNAALHGGVNRIELFAPDGRSLARRLVWNDAPGRALSLDVRQSRASYDAFEPVALEMQLSDAARQPVSTTFSLAVHDADGDLVQSAGTSAAVGTLLASELKGYVHRPEQYFDAEGRARTAELDLLLMVQGWTANSLETMNGRDTFRLQQPIEEALTLGGYVYEDNNRRVPRRGVNVSLKMYTREGGALEAATRTDSAGRFDFVSAVDFTGPWIAQFHTTEASGEEVWSRVALDRWFEPTPRRLDPRELSAPRPTPSAATAAGRLIAPRDTFAWRDTIPRYVASELGEAVVTHRNRYRGFTGNRYTWNGGEEAGMRQGDLVYDIAREAERYKDSGRDPGYIMDFLAVIDHNARTDRNFDSSTDAPDRGLEVGNDNGPTRAEQTAAEMELDESTRNETDRMLYRNRPTNVFLNNETPTLDVGMLLAEEVKTVAVMRGGARSQHVTGVRGSADAQSTWDVYIYEDPDYFRFRPKKGTERRRVEGYTRPRDFYHPNYRGLDETEASDVRRTLYWEPNVRTDAAGRASAVFFNNARQGTRLGISAHGLTPDGRFVDYEQ